MGAAHTGNDEDASKNPLGDFLFTIFIFFPKFFPTPHRAPFTADTEKKKNVERKSIYVTRQVSESLFPVIFTVNTSTFNSLKLTRFVIFIRWIFRVCEGGPPPSCLTHAVCT